MGTAGTGKATKGWAVRGHAVELLACETESGSGRIPPPTLGPVLAISVPTPGHLPFPLAASY